MKKTTNGLVSLDEKDRLLLAILQTEAEQSMAQIGKRLGLTKTSVSNRIRNLKNAGVLGGLSYQVDPHRVGEDYVILTQVTCNVSGSEQEKLGERIARLPGVQSVYLNFGPYDILFIARRRDKHSAKDLLYKVLRLKGVRNTLTTIPYTVIKETLEIQLEL